MGYLSLLILVRIIDPCPPLRPARGTEDSNVDPHGIAAAAADDDDDDDLFFFGRILFWRKSDQFWHRSDGMTPETTYKSNSNLFV